MTNQEVDISNFKKMLNPVPAGTGDAVGLMCAELETAVDTLKKTKAFLKGVSGEEYIKVLEEYQEYPPVYTPLEEYQEHAPAFVTPEEVATEIRTWTFPVTGRVTPPTDTNIDSLLDELSQKNQMIKTLSMTMDMSDRLFAKLLNKITIGIGLFFILTIIICYLAFS